MRPVIGGHPGHRSGTPRVLVDGRRSRRRTEEDGGVGAQGVPPAGRVRDVLGERYGPRVSIGVTTVPDRVQHEDVAAHSRTAGPLRTSIADSRRRRAHHGPEASTDVHHEPRLASISGINCDIREWLIAGNARVPRTRSTQVMNCSTSCGRGPGADVAGSGDRVEHDHGAGPSRTGRCVQQCHRHRRCARTRTARHRRIRRRSPRALGSSARPSNVGVSVNDTGSESPVPRWSYDTTEHEDGVEPLAQWAVERVRGRPDPRFEIHDPTPHDVVRATRGHPERQPGAAARHVGADIGLGVQDDIVPRRRRPDHASSWPEPPPLEPMAMRIGRSRRVNGRPVRPTRRCARRGP